MSLSRSAVIWILRRALRPVSSAHRRRWVRLQAEAEATLRRELPGRCWIGRGAMRDHAVYNLLGFYSICGQPVGYSVSGDMPGDIDCWSCRRRLNKAAGMLIRETGIA